MKTRLMFAAILLASLAAVAFPFLADDDQPDPQQSRPRPELPGDEPDWSVEECAFDAPVRDPSASSLSPAGVAERPPVTDRERLLEALASSADERFLQQAVFDLVNHHTLDAQ